MKFIAFFYILLFSISIFGQGSVTDIDGNTYKTVKIGEQEWMAENLKTTHYHDGQPILTWKDSLQWVQFASVQAAYCWYKNDSITYKPKYGALYNYHAAQDNRLCPIGWRVPSQQDFYQLIRLLDPQANIVHYAITETAGKLLKEEGHNNWPIYENVVGSNTTGFSAIGAGCRGYMGWYNSAPYFGYYWGTDGWTIAMRYATDRIFMRNGIGQEVAVSVRCVKGYSLPVYSQLFNKNLTK